MTDVAVRDGNVYLTSPITGEVREVAPDDAAAMLQSGWQPPSEQSAEGIRAEQIPREAVAAEGGLGKFGYGVARGVMTPLVDLALPEGNRINELLSGDSPWLTGGGEAVGMIGSALTGFGAVGALEQGSARVAARLGAGNGMLRAAFGRGVAGAGEGALYGAMGAVSGAHDENVPLTAQRFGSEVLSGLLFGGVLGGGFGAFEGVRTLPARIAQADKSKLDDIFRAGVSDEDALRIAKSEFGVDDPNMLQQFQAYASGGEATPALMKMASDSGPVGERMRKDLFFGQEQLNQAERKLVDVGGDFLVAREEAMRQIQSDLKRGHIEQMIGAGQASDADLEMLVRRHVSDVNSAPTIAGRDVVLEPLEVKLPKNAEREAFVDRVLDQLNSDQGRQLQRAIGASEESLRARLVNGLASNQNETIDALKGVLKGVNLSDDALRSLGEPGAWQAKPLDFMGKWRSAIDMVGSAPKGVHDAAGDFKKLLGNLEFREQAILGGNRANAASELDTLKKRLAAFAKPGERLDAGDAVAKLARDMYEDLRVLLEDPAIWGANFANKQQKINEVLHRSMGVGREFDDAFVKEIGLPDPDAKGWRNARVVDSGKVTKALKDMSEPKRLEQLQRMRDYLDDQKKFFNEVLGFQLPGQAHVRIQSAIKHLDQFREALDKGVYLNARAKQAHAMLGFGPLGSGWEARAALGAVVGGAPGAVGGLVVSAALNPGKMLQMRAIAERMAESTGSRVWGGIAALLGLKPGKVLRGAAKQVGRPAKHAGIISAMLNERGDERAKTYSETVKQLTEARARLGELDGKLDSTMPVLEQALPGTKAQMLGQAQRGMDYVLDHLPVTPTMRLYGERAAPLNDQDYENFIRMTMAATDPTSILEMAAEGELTPQAVAAAEYTAPEFVQYVRSEMVRAISDHGADSISYDKRISASLVMGTPLDESLEPEYIAIQQATHEARKQKAAEGQKPSRNTGKETGVNQQYQSEGDRLESGVPPQ